jgi:hypothetical protein
MKTIFTEQTAGTAEKIRVPRNTTAAGVASADAAQFTSVSPAEATAVHVAPRPIPEFIRLPKPGQLCPWTGLSRSKMNELVLPGAANDGKPPVKSVFLRKKGSLRGCRLVVYESLVSFLKNKLNQSNENE